MQIGTLAIILIVIVLVAVVVFGTYLPSLLNKGRRKNKGNTLLAYAPTEAQSYFDHLLAEYALIPEEDVSEQYKKEITRLRERSPEALTWDHLLKMELILLEIMPIERLKRKAWITRARFRDVVGAEIYKEYLATNPPLSRLSPPLTSPPSDAADLSGASPPIDLYLYDTTPDEELALRGDLQMILQDTFWRFRIRTAWEDRRNWFAKAFGWIYVVLVLSGLVPVILLIYLPPDKANQLHPIFTMVAVTMIGALGGFVSMFQRLQSLPSAGQRNENLIEMVYGGGSILLQSLLSGACFSLVLLFIFLGGLLRGGLFPDYPNQDGATFIDLLRTVSLNGTQFAKLLVWSFIAGFAERFVPDFLDRFSAKEKARDANSEA
ncbi:MAG TPA: hypothetical protein VF527_11080 [Pyrinomonadaceae bacterium]|jgi:hypothetical protein